MVLGGLASAGYVWGEAIEGSSGVVRLAMETAEGPAPPPPAPGGPPPGTSSRDQAYLITAIKPGQARVRFYLHRPWERDKPPLREVIVDVTVTP